MAQVAFDEDGGGLPPIAGHLHFQSMDHHYVPQFLLKQWTDETGRLVRYRRAYGKLSTKRMFPKATGYGVDLYAFTGLTTEIERQALETGFMQKVDERGAVCLQALLQAGGRPPDDALALDWCRFVSSMISRSPGALERMAAYAPVSEVRDLAALEPEYQRRRHPDWAPTLAEHVAAGETGFDLELAKVNLDRLISSDMVLETINRMHWTVVRGEDADLDCLLTDEPVRFGGFRSVEGFVIMPIGPRAAFLAAGDLNMFRVLSTQMGASAFFRKLNADNLSAARELVLARDEKQRRLIEDRFHPDVQTAD
ncbi:DUF4238 domain-containing protein [Brevundimonas sp.]|jgi:Protein of unknown function (DUF4238)|uniref:DUF4238 domain-containing protein n=1 Tax=Brevundimonas sp. TaxID=1871086 RepID=UPI0028983702|nr:DUF4238 domain-containing protein [Brevundimonas sp.]